MPFSRAQSAAIGVAEHDNLQLRGFVVCYLGLVYARGAGVLATQAIVSPVACGASSRPCSIAQSAAWVRLPAPMRTNPWSTWDLTVDSGSFCWLRDRPECARRALLRSARQLDGSQ